ncbi:MAG TPA: DUF192 domain-containing protein [Candidatus Nanoarchaeia archaeon]|nr:DUF192 domain-containing protein [Candidatus Nanoarchaeia archaeon]
MITHKTTQQTISNEEIVCDSFASQARGLMFRSKQNLIMKFPQEKKISLHMFFVFYPIDVLLLNQKKEIVEIKKNFKPFSFWNSQEKGKYVVELAFPGEYKVGDRVEIKV